MGLLKNGEYRVTFPSHIKYLAEIEAITSEITDELAFEESVRDDLSIAVTELFNNALHHGNKDDESKKITIIFRVADNALRISVQDEGEGFEPGKLRDPLAPENIYEVNGRGLFLVKQLVDDIEFNITPQGSEVVIIKKLPEHSTE